MKQRSGFLFTALYLKQCAVSLQHYYAGNYQIGDSLSVPISLTRCGISRIIPIVLRKRIREKSDHGDILVRIYLSWFGLAKLILVAKKVRKANFSSIATSQPDIGCVLGVLDEMKISFKEIQPIYLPFLKDIPLELGMSRESTWKSTPLLDTLVRSFGLKVDDNVNKPLGYYGSWSFFSLSHHYPVWLAAKYAYPTRTAPFADYALLGDDILINNIKVVE
ncbi:hypothetical protein BC332_01853 [Capsicum chinense]|nr:hypothetical protein BC332_01853 [Capsicum chinense]